MVLVTWDVISARRIYVATDQLTFETRNVNRLRSDLNRFQTGQKKDTGTQVNDNIFISWLCLTNTAENSLNAHLRRALNFLKN